MSTTDTASLATGLIFGGTASIIYIAIVVLLVIGMWKMYEKAGKPGWASLIPFYNVYCLFQITLGNGWLFLLLFIPFVNFVMLIVVSIKLAQVFGKGIGFGILNIFFAPIMYCVYGFGSSSYIGSY